MNTFDDYKLHELQEIQIATTGGNRIHIWIEKGPMEYCLMAQYIDHATGGSSFIDHSFLDRNIKKLFESFVAIARSAFEKKGDIISVVDNPCNAPLLSAADQKTILRRLGVNAELKVNGQPS